MSRPMNRPLVIAIDGPAGAGKSSIAAAVAVRLGIARLDTGSMYRAVTWAAGERVVSLEDEEALALLAADLDLSFSTEGIAIDGIVREREIRDPAVTETVSRVSRHPAVRRVLVARQKELAHAGPAVIEGRDIGSVVAPWAPVKIFLTASAEERARRRAGDLARAGHDVPLARLQADIEARDRRDSETTPLQPADGAIVIDSTGRTIEQIVDQIAGLAAAAAAAAASEAR